jgi:hypothetical protein
MTFQVQLKECERDIFTWQYFHFLDELEKSLTQTCFGVSKRHVMEEAKAPVLDFCEMSVSYK